MHSWVKYCVLTLLLLGEEMCCAQVRFGLATRIGYGELYEIEKNSVDNSEETYQWFWHVTAAVEANLELIKFLEIGVAYESSVSGNYSEEIIPQNGIFIDHRGSATVSEYAIFLRGLTPRYKKFGVSGSVGYFNVKISADDALTNDSKNSSGGIELSVAFNINLTTKLILFVPSYHYRIVSDDLLSIGKDDTGYYTLSGGLLYKF